MFRKLLSTHFLPNCEDLKVQEIECFIKNETGSPFFKVENPQFTKLGPTNMTRVCKIKYIGIFKVLNSPNTCLPINYTSACQSLFQFQTLEFYFPLNQFMLAH